jgi:hypothetical protein
MCEPILSVLLRPVGYSCRMACVGVAALVMLFGCTPIQVWMGYRVRLEKTPIATIQASLPKGPGMFPGEKTPLVVTVTGPDGLTLLTEGADKGKILWEDLQVTSTMVTVSPKGIVALPADPRFSDGIVPHLTITVPSHPDVRAELDIPLRYDNSFTADFSGRAGSWGASGNNGMDGSTGSSGSMDPQNPSPGGRGSDGGSGSNGWDGGPGEDAPAVLVQVTLRPGDRPLLQIGVSGAGRTEWFLVDPQGGSLTVKAEGGLGGAGGSGGRGGRGGSGGSGWPTGLSGSDGSSGSDGHDGSSGKGGAITMVFDPQAKAFLGAIRFFNRDGSSRSGPLPVFKETPVPPLW